MTAELLKALAELNKAKSVESTAAAVAAVDAAVKRAAGD